MVQFCFCWSEPASDTVKANSSPPRNNNDDDTYGTIDDPITLSSKKNSVSLRTTSKVAIGNRHSTPSTRPPTRTDGTPNRKSVSFFPFMKKLKTTPQRELPQVPKKSFSQNGLSIDADPSNPMYECIGDGENDSFSDPLYSKVEDQPVSSGMTQRYDYPMFRSNQRKHQTALKKRNLMSNGIAPIVSTSGDEPLYTSASAIYSGGSEDPYSSIVSEAGGRGRQGDDTSIYDHGYARVKDPSTVAGPSRLPIVIGPKTETDSSGPSNIDQLYAKINHPTVRRVQLATNEPSSSTMYPLPSSLPAVDLNQTNESGSGSIVSGTSTNPSYRYLTVRETVDVVRERVRQRQETAATAAAAMPPVREHYYSTIANEYESVSSTNPANSSYETAITGASLQPNSIESSSRITPLTLNVARLSDIYEQAPPRPPTSPIPSRQTEDFGI